MSTPQSDELSAHPNVGRQSLVSSRGPCPPAGPCGLVLQNSPPSLSMIRVEHRVALTCVDSSDAASNPSSLAPALHPIGLQARSHVPARRPVAAHSAASHLQTPLCCELLSLVPWLPFLQLSSIIHCGLRNPQAAGRRQGGYVVVTTVALFGSHVTFLFMDDSRKVTALFHVERLTLRAGYTTLVPLTLSRCCTQKFYFQLLSPSWPL